MPIMTMSHGRFAQMFCCYWKMLLSWSDTAAASAAALSLLHFGAQWFRQVVNNFARLFRSTWSATIPFYSMVWTIVWTCLSILHSVVCSDIPTFQFFENYSSTRLSNTDGPWEVQFLFSIVISKFRWSLKMGIQTMLV